jgi:hypothetical protein
MRKYYFTCASVVDGKLAAETYFVENRDDAFSLFKESYKCAPLFLEGPFYRKLEKNKKKINFNNIKLSNKSVKAIYNGNQVKAIMLSEPENYAFLIYLNNKNNPSSKSATVVHISELKELK